MGFAVSFARFFRTTILYYINNHIKDGHVQNRCSKNSRKIPLLESLSNKAAGLRPVILLKKTLVFSCEF